MFYGIVIYMYTFDSIIFRIFTLNKPSS